MAFGFPGVKLEGSLFLGVRGIGVSVASQYWGALGCTRIQQSFLWQCAEEPVVKSCIFTIRKGVSFFNRTRFCDVCLSFLNWSWGREGFSVQRGMESRVVSGHEPVLVESAPQSNQPRQLQRPQVVSQT